MNAGSHPVTQRRIINKSLKKSHQQVPQKEPSWTNHPNIIINKSPNKSPKNIHQQVTQKERSTSQAKKTRRPKRTISKSPDKSLNESLNKPYVGWMAFRSEVILERFWRCPASCLLVFCGSSSSIKSRRARRRWRKRVLLLLLLLRLLYSWNDFNSAF